MDGQHSPNILVVDDEKYICSIIVEALASEGCNVVSLSDPAAALEFIHNNPVDLILSDLVMGEYSGVQMLETTLTEHPDAIVILMTAHPTVQTAISVLKAGAYDFLVKPFKLEMLKATIRRGLDHQQIYRENVRLRAQVEFLKVASAAGAKVDLSDFLGMVARSTRKETDAAAVGIIEVDPQNMEVVRHVYESRHDVYREEVLDHAAIECFRYNKSIRPKISSEQITEDDETFWQTKITQPIYSRRVLHGVINLIIKSRFNTLTPGQMSVVSILANSAASAMANQRLYQDLRTSYLQAIRALANAVEARDECTAGHTDRVCRLAELVSRELGWEEQQIEHLVMGCTLHDIGKIGVPDSILNKPSKLTDDERQRMMAHPETGLMIVDGIDLFRPALPYIIAHHEWYDGTGYPNGLAGDEIPVEGRLLAVADTFDAIMSDRPYRQGANLHKAVSELQKQRGIQFDPEIVDVLLRIIRRGDIDFNEMWGRDEDLSEVYDMLPTEKAPV